MKSATDTGKVADVGGRLALVVRQAFFGGEGKGPCSIFSPVAAEDVGLLKDGEGHERNDEG